MRLFERSRLGAAPTPAALAIVEDARVSVAASTPPSSAPARSRAAAGQLTVGLVTSALFDTLPRARANCGARRRA